MTLSCHDVLLSWNDRAEVAYTLATRRLFYCLLQRKGGQFRYDNYNQALRLGWLVGPMRQRRDCVRFLRIGVR